MSDDRPSEADLAMAQAGQTAEALADLNRPSAEEQRAADEESASLIESGVQGAAEEGVKLTDLYTRVNTAHGAGAGAVLVQNPYTFSDDIARGNLPPTATDPSPDAQPPEPDTPPAGGEGEQGEQRTGLSPNPAVYPNLPYGVGGTPEDVLYRETGLITQTVSNVDGVSSVEVDPSADQIEAPVAGDAAPQTAPPDDKATVDDVLTEGADQVDQVESDYDPSAHTVAEVNEYIAAHPEEEEAILTAEEAGKNRAGIIG